MNRTARSVQRHYLQAVDLALIEVERLARKILADHPNLNEFVMAGGDFMFTTKEGDDSFDPYVVAYTKSFTHFMGEWDNVLKLTGTPMRFTATGKKITDW